MRPVRAGVLSAEAAYFSLLATTAPNSVAPSLYAKIPFDPSKMPTFVAKSLDLVGDRWTLLIVRDLLFKERRTFKEFAEQWFAESEVSWRRSYRVTADALGRWAYHCHLLYHMEMGMFREVRVEE